MIICIKTAFQRSVKSYKNREIESVEHHFSLHFMHIVAMFVHKIGLSSLQNQEKTAHFSVFVYPFSLFQDFARSIKTKITLRFQLRQMLILLTFNDCKNDFRPAI